MNRYQRKLMFWDAAGVQQYHTIDIYDVLVAYDVTCPAIQHAIKKLLMPGKRGKKTKRQDLDEAAAAIERAIELLPSPSEALDDFAKAIQVMEAKQ